MRMTCFVIAALILAGCGTQEPAAQNFTSPGVPSQGPAGPAGKDGVNGTNGVDGKDGVAGKDGTNGVDGADCEVTEVPANDAAPNGGSLITCGHSHSLVLNGSNGVDGANGKDGTDGQDGIAGTDGLDGTNGINGSNGIDGLDGKDGRDGTNGTNGVNGTIVAPVQFCPGVNKYPSTFPEVGFCINDQIYAVYSANGGFLTVVSPGNWSSNAIGSSCNFTVAAHCKVIN